MERSEWRFRPHQHKEQVRIDPSVSHEAQFMEWLSALRLMCNRHKHTRLKVDESWSRKASLPQPLPTGEYDEHMERHVRSHNKHLEASVAQGIYPFTAMITCPACKLEYAQVPPEFYDSTFDTFIASSPGQQHNLTRCRQFVAQVDKAGAGFLLMVGMPGSGKTRLGCNILHACQFRNNLYVAQAGLLIEHRKTYRIHVHHRADKPVNDDDGQPKTLWQEAEGADMLIFDEIGTQPIPPGEMLLVDHLIKYRYDRRKPTILISNLPLCSSSLERPGFKEFVGDALFDRIQCATGNGKYILQFSEESFRRHQGDDYLAKLR